MQIRRFLEPGILRDDFYWYIQETVPFDVFCACCYISLLYIVLTSPVSWAGSTATATDSRGDTAEMPSVASQVRGATSAQRNNEFACVGLWLKWIFDQFDWVQKNVHREFFCHERIGSRSVDVMGRFKSLNLLRPSLKNQQQTRSELGWHFFYPPVPWDHWKLLEFFFQTQEVRDPLEWRPESRRWFKQDSFQPGKLRQSPALQREKVERTLPSHL